jgi:hypothetical protein
LSTFDLDPEALRYIHNMLDSILARVDEIREAITGASTPVGIKVDTVTATRMSATEIKVEYKLTGSIYDLGRIGTIIAGDPSSWIDWSSRMTGRMILTTGSLTGGTVLFHVWSNSTNSFAVTSAEYAEWPDTVVQLNTPPVDGAPKGPPSGPSAPLPAPGPELAALSDAEALAARRPPGLPLDALGNAIEDLPAGPVRGHTDESGVPVLLPLPLPHEQGR